MESYLFHSAYFYGFDIAAFFNYTLILLLTLQIFGGRNTKDWSLRTTVFALMAIDGVLSVTLDILTAYTNTPGNYLGHNLFITNLHGYLANFSYLVIHNLQSALFLIYVLAVVWRATKKNLKVLTLRILVFYFITLALLLTNFKTGWVFTYDATRAEPYMHGPLVWVMYSCSLIYLLIVLIAMTRYRRYFVFNDAFAITFFTVGAILSVIVQLLLPSIWVELFIQSFILGVLMLVIQARHALFEQSTGCFNKESFQHNLELFIRNKLPVTVVVLRMSGLSYFSKFVSEAAKDQIILTISRKIKETVGIEDIYMVNSHALCLIIPNEEEKVIDGYYDSTVQIHKQWEHRDKIRVQMAKIHVPEDAKTVEQVLLFVNTKFKNNQAEPYYVSQSEIRKIREDAAIEAAVERAIRNQTLFNVYQPIVDQDGKIHSVEVLSRIVDEKLGFIPPFRFITAAEKNGMIWELGLMVLENACKLLSNQTVRDRLEYVEINLSPVQFMHGGCREAFMEILNRYQIEPSMINFEITESASILSSEDFIREKDLLKECGFTFSIDDYGSGFSNYQYIKNVGPIVIKLDRDTLLAAETSKADGIFYQDTVRTMHDLGLKVVSEGVETPAQLSFINESKVDFVQGYYYAKPLPENEFVEYCREN